MAFSIRDMNPVCSPEYLELSIVNQESHSQHQQTAQEEQQGLRVAVVGATGAVGEVMLETLSQRRTRLH